MKDTSHTLLATTGASPQVVTETLYAIHHENQQWPDDIFLITTSFGKQKAVKGLIEDGHLPRLCSELQRPMPAFTADNILVTPGADGAEVEDARSLADHEALADFIMTEVRNRTAGTETSLYASLAGGRKTMTFYLGYAMSLFGRKQDTLSHVLVSEGYENNPDFWFPTTSPQYRRLEHRGGNTLDASQARITLAPIPFIRHRHNLPKVLLQESSTVKFTDLVELINLGENPDALRLIIDLPTKTIRIQDNESRISHDLKPGLLELVFYSMMARATRDSDSELARPQKGEHDKGLTSIFMDELLRICSLESKGSLKPNIEQLKGINDLDLLDRSLDALSKGINLTWFDSRQTHLRQKFERDLPDNLLRWVLPSIIWPENGNRKGGGYGINLNGNQIRIIDP